MTINNHLRFGSFTAILIFAIASCFSLIALHAAENETMPLAINLDDVPWGQVGGGNGSPLGLRTARQGVDPETGGVTYYAMFPAGTHFDLHWHTHDEFVSVQKGSVVLELGDETFTLNAGAYIVIPGKMNHSWDVPEQGEVVILVRRAGPADRTYVEPH
jgi:mannose-6-phosphate isomerase-like protein (cupin superfamily)